MSIQEYPLLRQLRDEVNRLEAHFEARDAARRREGVRVVEGRDLARLTLPWVSRTFWLTRQQMQAVRLLLDAATNSASPDVEDRRLMAAAGAAGKVMHLFAGVEGWRDLIHKGERAGTWRVALPPEGAPEEPPITVVPWDE